MAKQFVLIEGDKYTFFLDKCRVASVIDVNKQMTPQWVETYRKDHRLLLQDVGPPPEYA